MKSKPELRCPYCRSTRLIKRGRCWTAKGHIQRWECKNPSCGKLTIVPIKVKKG